MSSPSTSWPPPVIESFELEKSPPLPGADPGFPQPLARVIVRGQNFFIRAVSPKITLGDRKILDFEILPDEKTILLYLFERPAEGTRITIDYGSGLMAQSPQLFSWGESE